MRCCWSTHSGVLRQQVGTCEVHGRVEQQPTPPPPRGMRCSLGWVKSEAGDELVVPEKLYFKMDVVSTPRARVCIRRGGGRARGGAEGQPAGRGATWRHATARGGHMGWRPAHTHPLPMARCRCARSTRPSSC